FFVGLGVPTTAAHSDPVATAVPTGTIELSAEPGEVALSPHVTYRHDTGGGDVVDDAWRQLAAGAFAPLPGGNPAFGFQDGAFWVHSRVVNRDPAEPRWLLVQSYSLSARLDLSLRYPYGYVEH